MGWSIRDTFVILGGAAVLARVAGQHGRSRGQGVRRAAAAGKVVDMDTEEMVMKQLRDYLRMCPEKRAKMTHVTVMWIDFRKRFPKFTASAREFMKRHPNVFGFETTVTKDEVFLRESGEQGDLGGTDGPQEAAGLPGASSTGSLNDVFLLKLIEKIKSFLAGRGGEAPQREVSEYYGSLPSPGGPKPSFKALLEAYAELSKLPLGIKNVEGKTYVSLAEDKPPVVPQPSVPSLPTAAALPTKKPAAPAMAAAPTKKPAVSREERKQAMDKAAAELLRMLQKAGGTLDRSAIGNWWRRQSTAKPALPDKLRDLISDYPELFRETGAFLLSKVQSTSAEQLDNDKKLLELLSAETAEPDAAGEEEPADQPLGEGDIKALGVGSLALYAKWYLDKEPVRPVASCDFAAVTKALEACKAASGFLSPGFVRAQSPFPVKC